MTADETVTIEIQVPYERQPDGTWLAEAEIIDDDTLRQRQQVAADVAESRRRAAAAAAYDNAADYLRALELPGAADGVEVLARVALAGASHAIEEEADG